MYLRYPVSRWIICCSPLLENGLLIIAGDLGTWPEGPSDGITTSIQGSLRTVRLLAARPQEKILSWIQECATTHKICSSLSDLSRLPKRVIDVGEAVGAKQISLWESDNAPTRYVALSHCWGKKSLITTTTETLPDRITSIPWSELSQTFQDAVLITQWLGVRYLWIDSLCILQDSVVDWQDQSSKMAEVYENSHATLVATYAQDGSEGCLNSLHSRPELRFDYQVATARLDRPLEPVQCSVFVRPKFTHYRFEESKLQNRSPRGGEDEHYPLLSRAWCFQERVLARRVLHFTRDEMIFECHEGFQCECGGIEVKDAFNSISDISSYKKAMAHMTEMKNTSATATFADLSPSLQQELNNSAGSLAYARHIWRAVVTIYISKHITYATDVLPALSAMARRMPLFMGRYIAGLWEGDLVFNLLWMSTGKAIQNTRPDRFVAPSFSWASRTGPISYHIPSVIANSDGFRPGGDPKVTSHLCVTILEVQYATTGVDLYGGCESASITLEGRLFHGVLRKREDEHDTSLEFAHPYEEGVPLAIEPDAYDTAANHLEKTVYCLPVLLEPNTVLNEPIIALSRLWAGLILAEVEVGIQPGTRMFHRIGIVQSGLSRSAGAGDPFAVMCTLKRPEPRIYELTDSTVHETAVEPSTIMLV